MIMPFRNRSDAGRRLAGKLMHLREEDVAVLGLPRGGVPVAFEIARALDAPLDVILVRKVGLPVQPELAMGAIGEDGVRVINTEVVRAEQVTPTQFDVVENRERAELSRRADRFRGGRPRVPIADRTVIIVDDGVATGSTARVACEVARAHGAARVVLAVPVAPRSTIAGLSRVADEVVCLETPEPFFAIGQWYADFSQTADEEVVSLLDRAAQGFADPPTAGPHSDGPGAGAQADPPATALRPSAAMDEEVTVQAARAALGGHLTVPPGASGIVVFAHGSGSGRHSPRNMLVAGALNEACLGTLLFDLLTTDEEADRANVFDIGLLARRLTGATQWLRDQPGMKDMRVGYFGASTGAAAALRAAAEPETAISAVVSRGGRPDLAGSALESVRAPVLLIVGGQDDVVLRLNQKAQARLHAEARLAVVPGATHLFEEPGALEEAAALATEWFSTYLGEPPAST
jgi:putative phosphoribosyl transferase